MAHFAKGPFLTGLLIGALGVGGTVAYLLFQRDWSRPTGPGRVIEANCGLIASADVRSRAVRLTCGLDESGVSAVVADAVAGIEIGGLIAAIRAGELPDDARVGALAETLGITPGAARAAVETVALTSAPDDDPQAALVALLAQDLEVVEAPPEEPGSETTDNETAPMPPVAQVEAALGEARDHVNMEAERLIARCGALIGGEAVTDEGIDIRCQPTADEVQAIVDRVLGDDDLRALTAELRQRRESAEARLEDLAEQLGLSPASLRLILEQLQRGELPGEAWRQELAARAAAHSGLSMRLGALDETEPAIAAVKRQVATALIGADYGTADLLLASAEHLAEIATLEASVAPAFASLVAAARSDAQAQTALLDGRHRDAAEALADATELVPPDFPLLRSSYALRQGGAWHTTGRLSGDEAALRTAVRLLEDTEAQLPALQSEVLSELGGALTTLGETEIRKDTLEQAVAVLEQAAPDELRTRSPEAWARVQTNLGVALWRLGQRKTGTAHLQAAVEALENALALQTPEEHPDAWATAQINLATVLTDLGRRKEGTQGLQDAVAAYQAVLEREASLLDPTDRAITRNNLGNALHALAGREQSIDRLREAADAYRTARAALDAEQHAALWAMSTQNLASVRIDLGTRAREPAEVEGAIRELEGLLELYQRDTRPYEWGRLKSNIAQARLALVRLDQDPDVALAAALADGTDALEVFDPEDTPMEWVRAQWQLGEILALKGTRAEDPAVLREAQSTWREALKQLNAMGMADVGNLASQIERLEQVIGALE